MRPKALVLCKALIVILLAALTTSAQFQIRTRVDLVVVPVTVKNSGGELTAGLTKADFRVYENGREQTITNFTADPVPLSVIVLVDSGLSPTTFKKIQNTLPALTEAFSAFDEVAVYRFDTHLAKLSEFSNNKDAVETALARLKDIEPVKTTDSMGGAPFSTPGPLINGMPADPSLRLPNGPAPKLDKILHDAMFAAADELRKRAPERRRVMVVVSDGRAGRNEHNYDQVLHRLLENNIEVYSIGMDQAYLSRKFSVLDKYSKATGGDAFFLNATDSLEHSYSRAAEEARNQYVLGYLSNNEAPAAEPIYRQIDVRLARAGLKVLHRSGYYQVPR